MSECPECPDLTDVGPEPCDPCEGTPRVCPPQEWTCGGWRYSEVDGCMSRTRLVGVMPDGVYQNATITVTNGCIAAVASGTNVVQQRPLPCLVSGGTPTPTPAPVSINPDACNLTENTGSGILSKAYFDVLGSNVMVTGCGTATSPWRLTANYPTTPTQFVPIWKNGVSVQTVSVNPVVSVSSSTLAASINASGNITINTEGADVDSCGVVIEGGLVKAFGGFVKTIAFPPGSGYTATYDSASCTVTITPPASQAASVQIPNILANNDGTNQILYGGLGLTYTLINTSSLASTSITIGAGGNVSVPYAGLPNAIYMVMYGSTHVGYVKVQ